LSRVARRQDEKYSRRCGDESMDLQMLRSRLNTNVPAMPLATSRRKMAILSRARASKPNMATVAANIKRREAAE